MPAALQSTLEADTRLTTVIGGIVILMCEVEAERIVLRHCLCSAVLELVLDIC